MGFSLFAVLPQVDHNSPTKLVFDYSINTSNTTSLSPSQLLPLPGADNPAKFLEQKAKSLAQNHQFRVQEKRPLNLELVRIDGVPDSKLLDISYERCRELFLREKDPHSIGIESFSERVLLGEDKAKAVWAIWAYGRRTDDFVDGFNGSYTTAEDMDRYRHRTLDALSGRPWNIYDLALADTVSKFPIDTQLFLDLIEGTKGDITIKTFPNYEQIYLYRYHVDSSFFLMLVQACGFSPDSEVDLQTLYARAIAYAIGLAEVDGYRDTLDDASMGRIYLPQDELALAGITNTDVFTGRVTPRWIKFMKGQMKRTEMLLDEGEKMINEMNVDSRWWVWTAGLVYRQHLAAIEPSDYNLTKKNLASHGKLKILWAMLVAYAKSHSVV